MSPAPAAENRTRKGWLLTFERRASLSLWATLWRFATFCIDFKCALFHMPPRIRKAAPAVLPSVGLRMTVMTV